MLLIGPLGTNSSESSIEIHTCFMQENAFENVCQTAAMLSGPQCVKSPGHWLP